MTEIKNSKLENKVLWGRSKFGKFDHLDLGFVSDFDIRISDFLIRSFYGKGS